MPLDRGQSSYRNLSFQSPSRVRVRVPAILHEPARRSDGQSHTPHPPSPRGPPPTVNHGEVDGGRGVLAPYPPLLGAAVVPPGLVLRQVGHGHREHLLGGVVRDAHPGVRGRSVGAGHHGAQVLEGPRHQYLTWAARAGS